MSGRLSAAVLIVLVCGLAASSAWVTASAAHPQPHRSQPASAELERLFKEDQADRTPPEGKGIDWAVVGPRDAARRARVEILYRKNALLTGRDYYLAAMVLQHGDRPDDALLAHEFCVAAISKAEPGASWAADARWLAAAAEDRFLMRINRAQRFGTQFFSKGPGEPLRLHPVDPEVTDGLRAAMAVPPLAEAKKKEAQLAEPGRSQE